MTVFYIETFYLEVGISCYRYREISLQKNVHSPLFYKNNNKLGKIN